MKSTPQITDLFPKGGYHDDLSNLPDVNFGTVWKYMIESSNAKKQLSRAKPLVKGFNFFKSGNVVKVSVCCRDNKSFLKSQVLPSMKKSSIYNCYTKETKCDIQVWLSFLHNFKGRTFFYTELWEFLNPLELS